jgi:putative DNA primase/helicase
MVQDDLPPDDAQPAGMEHTTSGPPEGVASGNVVSIKSKQKAKPKTPSSGRGKRAETPKDYSEIERMLARYVLLYGSKTAFDKDKHTIIALDALAAAFPVWFKHWKEHPERKMVDQENLVFAPEGKVAPGFLNLWKGMEVKPKKGSCVLLLELLLHLCGEDMDIWNWVCKWIAFPLKHPGAKMQTALVLHGDEGSGKNLFFETVMSIYGRYGTIIGQDQLESPYNEWASCMLFAIADEVLSRQELRHHKGRLNSYVTGTKIIINEKFIRGRMERNCANFVFMSNETMPLPLSASDRRHLVIFTPPNRGSDFYKSVKAEIDAGGMEALYDYFLKEVELGDFTEHTKPPMTAAKQRLIDVSLSSPYQFFAEWQAGNLPVRFVSCRTRDCYQAYSRWCLKVGDRFPFPMVRFKAEIERKLSSKIARIGSSNQQSTVFIVNPELRLPEQTEADWIGAAVEVFVEGLSTFSKGWNQGFNINETD